MKNGIVDLRNHLFEVIERVKGDTDAEPMDLDRARCVAEVAQTIINSAKVEIEHLKVTGALGGSGFIPDGPEQGQITGPKR